uniref:FHA domain-containing protein n=1 Tax=Spongospora subterranea TaxID=70186 RepID=A0A0H5RBH9_9EUKA|eukprot:CRZ10982.1 hypothetical protein [Spongospora subterranea]
MWIISSLDHSRVYPCRPGHNITVGRQKGHCIYLEGVQSVSRNHAQFNCFCEQNTERPIITILDHSKLGGVAVNGVKVEKNTVIRLEELDSIAFARHPVLFQVSWMNIHICLSRIGINVGSPNGQIGLAASAVGATLSRVIAPDCTHLVVKDEPAVITSKVACAFMIGIEVVTEQWLYDLANPAINEMPRYELYHPLRQGGSALCPASRFSQSCPGIFRNHAFVFFSSSQRAGFSEVVTMGDGILLDLKWRSSEQHILPIADIVRELRLLAKSEPDRFIAVMNPRPDRLEMISKIREKFTELGIICNDESLILSSIMSCSLSSIHSVASRSLYSELHSLANENVPPLSSRVVALKIPVEKMLSIALPESIVPVVPDISRNELHVPVPNRLLGACEQSPMINGQTVVADPDVSLQPVPAADVKDVKPKFSVIDSFNGAGSSAGNAIIVGFDIVERRVSRQTLVQGPLNFKKFRKTPIFLVSEYGPDKCLTVKSLVNLNSIVNDPRCLSLHDIERKELDESQMNDMFEKAAMMTNTSRRRRK